MAEQTTMQAGNPPETGFRAAKKQEECMQGGLNNLPSGLSSVRKP
jgi:hypothetical protein